MMKNKRLVLITTLSIFTALVIFGVGYAFFTALVSDGDNGSSIIIQTGSMRITYSDNELINISNMLPGDVVSKTVTVKNESDVDVTYDLLWKELSNSFTNRSESVMSITCVSDKDTCSGYSENAIPFGGNNVSIIDHISINGSETHTYVITIKFLETGSLQNYNQGKSINGKIGIAESDRYSSNRAIYSAVRQIKDTYEVNNDLLIGMTEIDMPSTYYMDAHTEYRYQGDAPSNYVKIGLNHWRLLVLFQLLMKIIILKKELKL